MSTRTDTPTLPRIRTRPSVRAEREALPEPLPEQEVLRCETTADFLAALPRLVGYTATDSLFVVLFSGKRTSGTMRIDLPRSSDQRHVDRYLDELCSLIATLQRRHGPSSPAVVVSSGQTFAEADGIPWRRFARRLERRLARQGQRVRELCCIAPDGWASYLDPAAPRRGRSLDEIAVSPLADAEPVPSLDDLCRFPAPSDEERVAVRAALARQGVPLDSGSRQVAALFAVEEPSLETVAGVIRAVNTELGWVELFQRLTREAAPLHARLASGMPSEASEASIRRMRLASERLARIAGLAPIKLKPRVYASCAMAWWLRGLESVAERQIAAALSLDPENEVARSVRKLLDGTPSPLMAAA